LSNDGADEKLDFNTLIGNILRYGVTISTILIVIGVLMIAVGDKPPNFPASLFELTKTDFGKPTLMLSNFVSGLSALNPLSIIDLGLLVLLSTPIARVGVSIALFAAEKDYTYVGLTVFVLTVLFISIFVVGPYLAA
jgi:uncharacterized membrane protein